MERHTAHDFDQELLVLFDAYVLAHSTARVSGQGRQYVVGGVNGSKILEQLSPNSPSPSGEDERRTDRGGYSSTIRPTGPARCAVFRASRWCHRQAAASW